MPDRSPALGDLDAGPCTCRVTGPDADQTKWNPTCPYHGEGGSMVATITLHRPPDTKKTSRAKAEQRKRQRNRLKAQNDRLRRAIAEHRTAIHNAGTVRVDSRDEAAAEAKHRADTRLWEALDG